MLYAVNVIRRITQQGTVFVNAPSEAAAIEGVYQELVIDVYSVFRYVREWDEVPDELAEVMAQSAEARPEEEGWILPDLNIVDESEDYA